MAKEVVAVIVLNSEPALWAIYCPKNQKMVIYDIQTANIDAPS
jgi:hypothetical protein